MAKSTFRVVDLDRGGDGRDCERAGLFVVSGTEDSGVGGYHGNASSPKEKVDMKGLPGPVLDAVESKVAGSRFERPCQFNLML